MLAVQERAEAPGKRRRASSEAIELAGIALLTSGAADTSFN